jgi:hypothetical protein
MRKAKMMDKQAVSAIVTFVLLTSIALIFAGNWLNVAVPQWGSAAEEEMVSQGQNQLIGLRASVKSQIYSDNTDFVIANYIKLGTSGEAWKGVGRANSELVFDPQASSLLFQNNTGNLAATKGNLKFSSDNLYYPDQDLIFESGAVIKAQHGSSAMVAPPEFSAEIEGTRISVNMALISLTGEGDEMSGNLGIIIYSRMSSREYNWYNWTNEDRNLIISITTSFPEAWSSYFETKLLKQGFRGVAPADTPDDDGEFKVTNTATTCAVTIANVDQFESTVAAVNIWFG